jgi:ATP-binding cassette subfamily C (CFTR/MRP) protein 3
LSHGALSKITVGHIINLLSNDVQKLDNLFNYLTYILIGPLHLIVVGFFAWQRVGASSLAGLAIMLLGIPLQGAYSESMIYWNFYYECKIKFFKQYSDLIKVLQGATEPAPSLGITKLISHTNLYF